MSAFFEVLGFLVGCVWVLTVLVVVLIAARDGLGHIARRAYDGKPRHVEDRVVNRRRWL